MGLGKIWSHKEDSYPVLKNVEIINQEPFELNFNNLTFHSIIIEWPDIPNATEYEISYLNKNESLAMSNALIVDLTSDTDYEFRVRAKIGSIKGVWSQILKIRTKKPSIINGSQSTGKDQNSITLT